MSIANPKPNPGYVYLVECEGYYKVGLALNVKARLSSLQVGNPYKVDLIYAVKTNYALELEEALHEYLEDFRHRGEWFKLSEGKKIDLLGRMVLFEKMKVNMELRSGTSHPQTETHS